MKKTKTTKHKEAVQASLNLLSEIMQRKEERKYKVLKKWWIIHEKKGNKAWSFTWQETKDQAINWARAMKFENIMKVWETEEISRKLSDEKNLD